VGRLLSGVTALLVYFSVATLLTAATGAAYLRFTGKLDNHKIQKLLAIARGQEEHATAPEAKNPAANDPVQTSYQERAEARGLAARDLELREQALKGGLGLIQSEKDIVLSEKERFDGRVSAFHKQLDALRAEALLSGRGNVRQILENMKPKQAKEQVLKMIEVEEMNEVVLLLSSLPTSKQAKIVSEFKSEEEASKLGEILRLIRQSVPEVSLIDRTKQQINK